MSGSDNVWEPAGDEVLGGRAAPAEGELPGVMDLINATTNDLMADPVNAILAGLPLVVGSFIAVPVALVVLYGGILLSMMPGIIAEDELILMLGALVGTLLTVVAFTAILIAIFTPITNGILRGVDDHIVEGTPWSISTTLKDMFKGLFGLIVINLIIGFMAASGVMLCYVGVFLTAIGTQVFFGFAMPLVVLHGESPINALKKAFAKANEDIAWHLSFHLVLIVASMIISYIPLVGVLLLPAGYYGLMLRGFHAVHGQGAAA